MAPNGKADDAAILALIARGARREAAGALIDAYGDAVFSFCLRMLRDRDVAADIRQKVFLEACRDLESFHGRSSFRTWAGYGQKFNAKLVLRNPGGTAQNVRVSLGANDIGATSAVLFDAPVQVATTSGTVLRQVTLYNHVGNQAANGPQRRALTTVPVPAGGSTTVNVICYVPGLGFGPGLQLVVESDI